MIQKTMLLSAFMMIMTCRIYAGDQPQISYTALSDAAKESGELKRYDGADTSQGSIKLEKNVLEVKVPRQARAYDVIPIRYSLPLATGKGRLAVEAIAFEDHQKAGDKPLYDLSIPGNMNIKIECLGTIIAG